MDSYLAIFDRSGLRALLPESAEGLSCATELQERLTTSACYWTVIDQGPASVVRELLEEGEPAFAMRMLQSHIRHCGPLRIDAPPDRLVA